MRRWIIVVLVLLVVLAGALAFALSRLDRWLEQNRAWIAAQVSQAVGREVQFDEVGVSLRGGVAGRLVNLRIADDPAYARDDFLRARSVRVALRVLPALFGRYEVRYVAVEAPELVIIRDAGGLNVSSMGGGAAPKPRPAEKPAAEQPAAALPAILVAAARIEDGRMRFIDRTVKPPAEYVVDQLDVRVSDLSPTTPVSLRVVAAVLGAKTQNVEVEGTVGPLGDDLPVDVTVHLDEVPPVALDGTIALKARVAQRSDGPPAVTGTATLRQVSAAPPGLPGKVTGLDSTIELRGDSAVVQPTRFEVAGVPIETEATIERFQPLRARYTVKAAEVDLGAFGAGPGTLRGLETSGTAELTDAGPVVRASTRSRRGSVRDVEYQDLQTEVAMADQVATLERVRVGAFSGTYEGSGRVDLHDADRPRFESRSIVRGMTVRDFLAHGFPKAVGRMEGRLDATLSATGAGRDWDSVRPTLAGGGRVDVHDGVLKDVNIAESVLGVTGIPGLSALVPPDLRTRYPEIFGTGDTRFEELGGDVRIASERLTTDNLRMTARDYAVTGQGGVGFDGRVDFTATLVASEKLTADIVRATKEARYLTNAGNRLAIPFRFVGVMPGVKPVPDAEWVARTLARAALGKGVEKLLDGVGGKKKGGKKKGGKERPEEELLRKGLEGLLGR